MTGETRSFLALLAATPARLTQRLGPLDPGAFARSVVVNAAGSELDTAPIAGSTLLAGALTDGSGAAELHRYTLAGLFSLTEPTAALRGIFPNLRVTRRDDIARISAAQLADHLAPDGPIELLVDMPGDELRLLRCLAAQGLLERVEQITIRACRDLYFEGGATLEQSARFLIDQGFAETAIDDSDDSFPRQSFALDQQRRRADRAIAAQAQAEKALAARDVSLKEARDQADQAAARVTQLEQERDADRARADQASTAATEAKTALSARNNALKKTQEKADQAAARITQLEQERDAERARADQASAAVTEAKTALSARDTALKEAQAKTKAATDRIAALDKDLARHQANLAEIRRLRGLVRDRDETILRRTQETEQLRLDQSRVLKLLQAQAEEMDNLRRHHARVFDEKQQALELLTQMQTAALAPPATTSSKRPSARSRKSAAPK